LGHKTLPWINFSKFDPKFPIFAITPYIRNTNIKKKKVFKKKIIAGGFTTVSWWVESRAKSANNPK
jgi:hypothetical protein